MSWPLPPSTRPYLIVLRLIFGSAQMALAITMLWVYWHSTSSQAPVLGICGLYCAIQGGRVLAVWHWPDMSYLLRLWEFYVMTLVLQYFV